MEATDKTKLQELARQIYGIEWMAVQADDASEGAKYEYVTEKLMELDQKTAVKLLLLVIEEHKLPDWFFERVRGDSNEPRGSFPLYQF